MLRLIFFVCVLSVFSAQNSIAQRFFGKTQQNSQKNSRELDSLPNGIIFYEGFDRGIAPDLPEEWSTFSLGDDGFYVGVSGDAIGQSNEMGFFAVPAHGLYALTNDDVCNCDKSQDLLISKKINLSEIDFARIGFSAYQNGSSGQTAHLQVRNGNSIWEDLFEIPAHGQWVQYSVDISKSNLTDDFQFRFLFDDDGNYASGLALDDIFISVEPNSSVEAIELFTTSRRNLGSGIFARNIPLSLARHAEMQFGLAIRNASSQTKNVSINASVSGPVEFVESQGTWYIEPGSNDTIGLPGVSGYSPYDTGFYNVAVGFSTDSIDDNILDNEIVGSFKVSDSIYSYIENSNDQTGILLTNPLDRAGSVFEWYAETELVSVWIGIHPITEVGSKFRIKLINSNVLSSSVYTSQAYTIAEEDQESIRIPIGEIIEPGRYYVVVEAETENVVLKSTSRITPQQGVSVFKPANRAWQNLAFYPDITLVTPSVDSNCMGHLQATIEQIKCPGDSNGAIDLHPLLMENPTFLWTNGATSEDLIGLSSDSFGVTVTDNSCLYTRSFKLDSPDPLNLDMIISPALCGEKDGELFLNLSGGVEPYTYFYDSIVGYQRKNNLPIDSIEFSVTDHNNCKIDSIVYVPGTDTLSVSVDMILPHCQQSDGQILVTTIGTNPIYYTWTTGTFSSIVTGLKSGVYTVTISDSLDCTIIREVMLPDSFAPALSVDVIENISCYGEDDGKITVSAIGDNLPFNYSWSNGASTNVLTDLPSGPYRLTVSDTALCRSFIEVEILEENTPLLTDFKSLGIKCHGDSSGEIISFIYGGVEPYNLVWSNAANGRVNDKLTPGDYSVTITDGVGCQSILNTTLKEQPLLIFQIDELVGDTNNNNRFDASIFTSTYGGTPPYEYLWSNGYAEDDLVGVDTGYYSVTVSDQFGCNEQIEQQLDAVILEIKDSYALSYDLIVYPNPMRAGQSFYVKSSQDFLQLTIHDVYGRELLKNNRIDLTEPLSIDEPGLYLIMLNTKSEAYFRWVAVQ